MILSLPLLVLYAFGIQYKNPRWYSPFRALAAAVAAAALVLDVLAQYTEWYAVFGKPRQGEHTISRRLDRMENDPEEAPSRREFARLVNTFLNACEPDGQH